MYGQLNTLKFKKIYYVTGRIRLSNGLAVLVYIFEFRYISCDVMSIKTPFTQSEVDFKFDSEFNYDLPSARRNFHVACLHTQTLKSTS